MIEIPEPRYDAETLREVVDDPAAAAQSIAELRAALAEPADVTEELYHRAMLTALLRITGDLDQAQQAGETALRRAEEVGTRAQQQTARIRLAHVYQWRGEFGRSNALFSQVLSHADEFGPIMAGFAYQHAGKNAYDQSQFHAATSLFEQALAARRSVDAPEDQIDSSEQALAAARRRSDA